MAFTYPWRIDLDRVFGREGKAGEPIDLSSGRVSDSNQRIGQICRRQVDRAFPTFADHAVAMIARRDAHLGRSAHRLEGSPQRLGLLRS